MRVSVSYLSSIYKFEHTFASWIVVNVAFKVYFVSWGTLSSCCCQLRYLFSYPKSLLYAACGWGGARGGRLLVDRRASTGHVTAWGIMNFLICLI